MDAFASAFEDWRAVHGQVADLARVRADARAEGIAQGEGRAVLASAEDLVSGIADRSDRMMGAARFRGPVSSAGADPRGAGAGRRGAGPGSRVRGPVSSAGADPRGAGAGRRGPGPGSPALRACRGPNPAPRLGSGSRGPRLGKGLRSGPCRSSLDRHDRPDRPAPGLFGASSGAGAKGSGLSWSCDAGGCGFPAGPTRFGWRRVPRTRGGARSGGRASWAAGVVGGGRRGGRVSWAAGVVGGGDRASCRTARALDWPFAESHVIGAPDEWKGRIARC